LELGPQRNLGGSNLDGIPIIYTSALAKEVSQKDAVRHTDFLLSGIADVLVWSELFAFGSTKCTFIQS
jgi:hypothetical protein